MKALILLGCPETPSQTPMAVYAFSKLTKLGYDVTIAANPAAAKLVKVSDPEGFSRPEWHSLWPERLYHRKRSVLQTGQLSVFPWQNISIFSSIF